MDQGETSDRRDGQQDVFARLRELLPTLRERYGVRTLTVFGSVARGDATSRSDIDIVVDLGPEPSYRSLVGVLEYLEQHLQRKVDLVTPGGIRPRLQQHIDADGVRVA